MFSFLQITTSSSWGYSFFSLYCYEGLLAFSSLLISVYRCNPEAKFNKSKITLFNKDAQRVTSIRCVKLVVMYDTYQSAWARSCEPSKTWIKISLPYLYPILAAFRYSYSVILKASWRETLISSSSLVNLALFFSMHWSKYSSKTFLHSYDFYITTIYNLPATMTVIHCGCISVDVF